MTVKLDMRLSPHFTLREMIASSTAARLNIDNTPNDNEIERLKALCTHVLEPIRNHYRCPIIPTSGFRSQALNKAIGGSKKSQHCKGEAVDFEIAGVNNYELARWIKHNINFDQLILEHHTLSDSNSGWVHVSFNDYNRKQSLAYNGYTDGYIDFNLLDTVHAR